MKNFIYILFSILGISMMFSCDEESKTTVPDDAVSPIVTSVNQGTYILERVNKEKDFQTIEWSGADFKINVAEKYSLQVDVKGGSYNSKKTIAEGISSPFTITIGDFNKALLNAGFNGSEKHDIQLRIISNNYLASDNIDMTITTYFDAEPYSIIGSAVGGWNPENDQLMTYNKEKEEYSITLDMKPGPFKFRAPVKDPENPWAFNYGLDSENEENHDNGKDINLKANGPNITVGGGNYTITFSIKNSNFSITQNSATEFSNWSDAKLDAVGDAISLDNENAKADASSWKWGNVLIADNEGLPTKSTHLYTWTWDNIILEANKGFKLRTLNGENASNDMSVEAAYSNLDTENSSSKLVELDGGISVSEKATFNITLTIDAANANAVKLMITDPAPKYPSQMYMIGTAVGDWNWDNTDVKMIPVNSHPNLFWKIVWLEKDGAFKLSPKKEFDSSFGGSDEKTVKEEYAKGGDNIPARSNSGYYMVVVDLDANKIAVSEAKVYLIGDAVGDWTQENADALFSVDNDNKKMNINKTLSATDAVRIYAWHQYFTDWWQSEFIILDGKIEYRGTGGDQDRVGVAGLPTNIDLNFIDNTGTITQ